MWETPPTKERSESPQIHSAPTPDAPASQTQTAIPYRGRCRGSDELLMSWGSCRGRGGAAVSAVVTFGFNGTALHGPHVQT